MIIIYFKDEKCKFSAANVGATDTGFTDIAAGDETALATAIATIGPISGIFLLKNKSKNQI